MQIREVKNKSPSTRTLKVWVMITRTTSQVMTLFREGVLAESPLNENFGVTGLSPPKC
jgi:hypothetical protein